MKFSERELTRVPKSRTKTDKTNTDRPKGLNFYIITDVIFASLHESKNNVENIIAIHCLN